MTLEFRDASAASGCARLNVTEKLLAATASAIENTPRTKDVSFALVLPLDEGFHVLILLPDPTVSKGAIADASGTEKNSYSSALSAPHESDSVTVSLEGEVDDVSWPVLEAPEVVRDRVTDCEQVSVNE